MDRQPGRWCPTAHTCVVQVQRHVGFVAEVEEDGAAGLVELVASEEALLPVRWLVPPVQRCGSGRWQA